MTCTLTDEPITSAELMTNIAYTNELLWFKTDTEALAKAESIIARELRFGRRETTASIEPAGKIRPRGMKFQVFVKRIGR